MASAARPAEAIKLLRRALRTLPVDSGDLDAITVRTKILLSMAYVQAETGPITDGLVHLGTARSLVSGMPRRPAQARRCSGFANQQHALILLRAGHVAEAIELFDTGDPAARGEPRAARPATRRCSPGVPEPRPRLHLREQAGPGRAGRAALHRRCPPSTACR